MNFLNNKKEKIFNFSKGNLSTGFTLIEVMISIGLFTVIMIIGITAILNVNNTYRKSRSMRSAIDNLSFIMEDMARNIRLGSLYRCLDDENEINPTTIEDPLDGVGCSGIAFEPFYDPISGEDDNLAVADQNIYLISPDGDLFKGKRGANFTDSDSPGVGIPMNSTDLKIDYVNSGFTIYGSSLNTDGEQPSVLIILSGTVQVGNSTSDFNLQTTVSQRLLDYPPNP
ncbi:MAG: prepilin-type N-terminal cleavage/methylation domain-containing protein [Candidatus Paceibacterota bacterium]